MSVLSYNIRHPAILKIEVRECRNGEWVSTFVQDNLSSISERRLKNSLLVSVTPPAIIDVTTLAGITYRKAIPAIEEIMAYLNDLQDVEVPSPLDGYVLYWDAATSLWKAKAVAASKIVDADGDTAVDAEKTADEDKVHIATKGVECALFHDDGILDLPKQSGCTAYRNGTLSIPNATMTNVSINAVRFDLQSEFNTTTFRFTATRAGYYFMVGVVYWQGNATGSRRILFRKSGSDIIETLNAFPSPGDSGFSLCTIPAIVQLNAGDYLEFWCYQNSGASLNIYGGYTNIGIWKLG